MSEYYSELFNDASIFKVDDNGNIFHLNTVALNWEEVSGVIDFDYSWTKIEVSYLKEMMLDFYIATSKYLLEIELKFSNTYKLKNEMGSHFKFYELCGYVLAIDDNNNQYTCNIDMMFPTTEDIILNSTLMELPKSEVIEKIKKLDEIDVRDMEVYKDLNNDYIFLSQDANIYKLSHYTGEITHCLKRITKNMDTWTASSIDEINNLPLDNIELNTTGLILHDRTESEVYLEKSIKKYNRTYKNEIGDLIFYRNPYGRVYGKNEKGVEVEVTLDTLKPVRKGTIEKDFERIKGEYVKNDIVLFSQRSEENRQNNKVTLYDLNLYYNLGNELCGISEDGNVYKMDKTTGELKKVRKNLKENTPRRGVIMKDVIKKRGEIIYYNEMNQYINSNEERIIKEGGEGFGDTITFYGRLLENDMEVYAMDSNAREYICDEKTITPIARGTINESFIEYQDKYVLTILKYESQAIKDRLSNKVKKIAPRVH